MYDKKVQCSDEILNVHFTEPYKVHILQRCKKRVGYHYYTIRFIQIRFYLVI